MTTKRVVTSGLVCRSFVPVRGSWILAFLVAAALPGNVAWSDGFRCSTGRLVSTGDTTSEVTAKCGPPESAEPVYETHCCEIGCCHVLLAGERWTYDLGTNQFVRAFS